MVTIVGEEHHDNVWLVSLFLDRGFHKRVAPARGSIG